MSRKSKYAVLAALVVFTALIFSDYDSVVTAGVTGDTLSAANAYFAQSPQAQYQIKISAPC